MAACLDAQGKHKEALAAYQDVASRFTDSPVAAQARLAAARLLEADNQPAQALKIYDELSAPTSTSPWYCSWKRPLPVIMLVTVPASMPPCEATSLEG